MSQLKFTRRIITLAAVTLLVTAGVALAAFSYRCPKCGLISTYNTPTIPKCPNDGWSMVPAR